MNDAERTAGRRPGRPPADRGDRGDIVIGWLTRLVVSLAVLGLIGFDAISIGVAKVGVVDDARSAVGAASSAWQSSHHNIVAAYEAAQQSLPDPTEEEVDVHGFSIDADGTVHLTVHKTAKTMLLYRVHKFAHYAVVSATESGKSIGS